ncbi:unnamed protein product, partial [Effrenium voratum]
DDQRLRQPPPGCEMLGDEGELIFRVLLSRDLTGLLIGNAGANIKELRRESGAKIVVRDDSVVGHRLATLSGSHESLAEALRRITELMEREADREEFQHYLRLINFGESEGAEPSGKGRHRPSPVEAEGFDGMRHLQQDLDSMPPGTSELSYSVCCALPASLVPALIGRSGDFVRSIEERTGAKVDIAREARGKDGYRKMECVGPLASIYAAHTLMMHRLQEVERAPERPARRPVPRHSGWSSANAAPLAPTATEKSQAEKQQDLRATIAELERKLLAARAVCQKVWGSGQRDGTCALYKTSHRPGRVAVRRPPLRRRGANVKMPPVMPLPPPPSAAAAQWAQHAYTASTQAAAAKAAAAKAAEVAAAQAAAAQAAATQAQVAQVSAQQAAAAQVAQSLGYNVAPVGVPTAAAYGDLPSAAPPYGLSSPNPMPSAMASIHPLMLVPAALATFLEDPVLRRRRQHEFLAEIAVDA